VIEHGLYRARFSEEELRKQRAFWGPICEYLQVYFPPDGTTVDLGAGFCHFINNIRAQRKLAVDINRENLEQYGERGVETVLSSGSDLSSIPTSSVDAVFASNVYEHFQTREEVAASFAEVRRILRSGSAFVILQPNFAYCAKRYFDFFDHRLVFTHRGMEEGLVMSGFKIEKVIPRFLPYTSKSALPKAPWLVRLYLHIPPVWRIFGGQMLIVARKNPQ
jgi:SAM-dependent methyltransferase